ncbi:MAG: molybdate ABC transporter substrate-binding protein [Methylococcales bacterium]
MESLIKMLVRFLLPVLSIFICLSSAASQAGSLRIAVASNFAHTMRYLAVDFEKSTGHNIKISSASTGKLYTQISHGAPFDIFLGADEARADLLITDGKAKSELSRVYALGKLTLLSNITTDAHCSDILTASKIKHLAIANPKTAPYGAAAKQVLEKLKQWDALKKKLVLGENIAQTLQFVSTGSASAGFVAQSMLINHGDKISRACTWDVPSDMYAPIKQKMVVLAKSEHKPASLAFWKYIQSQQALNIVKANGYDIL